VENSQTVVNLFALDGTLLYTNPAITTVLGWAPEDLIGRSGPDLLHPDDMPDAIATFESSLARPGVAIPFRHRMRHKDGSWRMVEGTGTNRLPDPDVGALVSSFQDITERVRIEQALREGEERYRTLFENAPVGIGVARADGVLLAFNDAMLKPGGYTREQIQAIGNVAALYADETERDAVLAELGRTGRVRHREVRFRSKQGGTYDALLSLTPVIIDGERSVMAIVEDISERRALEHRLAQSQKMQAVGQLAGGVAHDFNNLLTAIRGYADLCMAALPGGHPAHAYVSQIVEASDRASSVTRRLLAFARRERVEPRQVDVRATILDLEQLLRRLIGERIELKIGDDTGIATVRIDPSLFEQVVVNLAVNARDAMPEGGTLTIRTGRPAPAVTAAIEPAGTGWVEVTVTDTGSGMTPEVRARAFEPFFTTKSPERGTGLGLAMCYGLIQQAGGHIDIESEPGGGTSVRILLPLATPEAPPAPAGGRAATDPAAARPHGSETILLVEDESGVREFVRLALTSLGYRVLVARDGADAVEAASRHAGPIHLVLSDVVMPRMNGPAMAGELRGARPDTRFMFMSGYAEPEANGGTPDADLSRLLVKPFSVDLLAARLREALDPK
jgi:PAS domain S-box-containing protein